MMFLAMVPGVSGADKQERGIRGAAFAEPTQPQ
jgi:hypothetical protein